jgi:hypothetical protein
MHRSTSRSSYSGFRSDTPLDWQHRRHRAPGPFARQREGEWAGVSPCELKSSNHRRTRRGRSFAKSIISSSKVSASGERAAGSDAANLSSSRIHVCNIAPESFVAYLEFEINESSRQRFNCADRLVVQQLQAYDLTREETELAEAHTFRPRVSSISHNRLSFTAGNHIQ